MSFKFIEYFQEILANSNSIFAPYLKSNRSFKRSKKLHLSTVIKLIMSQLNRSLQIELANYFYLQGDITNTASKSAFVQARKKIKWELFREMNEMMLSKLDSLGQFQIRPGGKLKRVAIDGFKLLLPPTEALAKKFGVNKNQYKKKSLWQVQHLH